MILVRNLLNRYLPPNHPAMMKISPNSRELKYIVHLASMYIFSVPITTHILKLSLDETFIINDYEFTKLDSLLLILFILAIVSANIYSIVTDSRHKLTMLITGGFLSAVTMIQLVVLLFNVEMIVFGKPWNASVSIVEVCITGVFSIILLISAAYFEKDKSQKTIGLSNDPIEFLSIQYWVDYIEKLDRKLAFLLGLACSLLLVVPVCGFLYLAGLLLLDETHMDFNRMRLLGWIGIVGMQGSVISMLLSLRRFEIISRQQNNLGLFINALVRPFIGLSFAHLTFFMLESGLLQDAKPTMKNVSQNDLIYSFNYHVSIAFIAGFTERIARVIQPVVQESKQKESEKKPPSSK